MGGVVIGSKVGELLNKQAIFLERVDSKLILRRGFEIKNKSRVLIVEDVITTGKSSQECITALEKYEATILGVASIIDRSNQQYNLELPRFSLLNLTAPLYKPNDLPEALKKIPVTKPGSRFLK